MSTYETLRTTLDDHVLAVSIDAPPLNLIGPELVRDLVALIEELDQADHVRVVVFDSADPDFFIPHVDMTQVPEYTREAGMAGGPYDASLGMLFHRLSKVGPVTIAKIRGRARGAGSEFALACDMRFASRENFLVGQPEIGIGAPPGAGAVHHLAALLGRGRAMEVILGSHDLDADTAERYGWINRALPDADLDEFVANLARRIASFPAEAVRETKKVLNNITLPSAEQTRADARRFQFHVASPELQHRSSRLFEFGLQTRGALEFELGTKLGSLDS